MNFEFVKILLVLPQFSTRDNAVTLGSESKCSSTELKWDLYVKGGDNVFNARGRANEIGQSWCLVNLLDFQIATTGTIQRLPIGPMQTHVA